VTRPGLHIPCTATRVPQSDSGLLSATMKITDNSMPVETLIGVVKNSIKRAGVSHKSETTDLRVDSVRLVLKVVARKTAGGGLRFCVPFIGMNFSLGAKITSQQTHTIDMTLVPRRSWSPTKSAAKTSRTSSCRRSPRFAT
jgi:Trypsin-co-occurring domain 2